MAGDKDAAALAGELAGDAGASLNAFFDHAGLEAAVVEGEEEEELEWLSNKDAFPSVETMAVAGDVEAAAAALAEELPSARGAVGPRTKGLRRRRRVTAAPWNLAPLMTSRPPQPAAEPPRRRCTHCAVYETPQWRLGPAGPRTLCNACGVRFKSGRLFPEYRPANSPTFSPLLHSNSHRRVMEMRLQGEERKEEEEEEEEEDASAASARAIAKARRAERAAARSAGKDNN